jgi:hypothetical protein
MVQSLILFFLVASFELGRLVEKLQNLGFEDSQELLTLLLLWYE